MAGEDEMTGANPTLPSLAARSEPRGSDPGRRDDCLSEDLVLEYLEGRTTARARDRVDQHLDECNDCWLLVQSLIDGPGEAVDDEASRFRITTFAIGSLIADRYRIKSFVGRGGMGEVYLAHDALMSRIVALKTPLCTSSDDPSALRKFFDEARNADRITHPNICRIHALQEHRDPTGDRPSVLFFTMEYIDGESLAARLRRGPLPLSVTRVIARQLLDGLRAAHEKRVLHLDFKSDNVMLRRGGPSVEAVIMDFGLSRQRDAVLRASQYLRGIGTLPYMALEQLEGQRNLGPAVDVYAFGVVLFEMLTGRLPFVESSLGAMLLKQQRERPPVPSSLRPGLSSDLDAFVSRCLHRSASRRHEDAGAALEAFDSLSDWTLPGASSWRSRLRPLGAAALAAMLLAIPSSELSPPPSEQALPSEPQVTHEPQPRPELRRPEPQQVEERRLGLSPVAPSGGAPPSPDAPAVLPTPSPSITVATAVHEAAPGEVVGEEQAVGDDVIAASEHSRRPPAAERSGSATKPERGSSARPPAKPGSSPPPRRTLRALPPPIPLKGIQTRLGEGAQLSQALELAPVAQAAEAGAQADGE